MRLSIVVTVVDAGDALERCLHALATQRDMPSLDVIIPWDTTVQTVAALESRFPAFRFLALGAIETQRPPFGAAGQHELYDRRRSAGLAAATGDVIAVLEDRGVPRRDWAREMLTLHEHLDHAAIGGAIENGGSSLRHWAVYFCDFGRFGLPFKPGPRLWVSDTNIGYKRRALEQTRDLWRDRYHETTVHWALQRAGEELYLSPGPVVDQIRGPLRWGTLFAERFAWGRLFASTRALEATIPTRAAMTALSPLLPFVLLVRHARAQLPRRTRTFLLAAPSVFLLSVAWSAGEAVGYITSRG